MKILLKALFSTILISSTVLPVVACKNNKANENNSELEDSYNEMSQELKGFILDFFNGTKTTAEGKQTNDFSILSTKELGISSLNEFAQNLQSEGKIDEQNIIDLINNYIIDNRLPILEKALKKQFSETFAEETDDFISLDSNETIITNDSKSLKVDHVAKLLKETSNEQKLGRVLKSESIDSVVKSIIKFNINLSLTLNSKSFKMKINPEFSYYITDKAEATNEVIQKLKAVITSELQNNISLYYQQFLNDKLLNGKNITRNFNALTTTNVIKEVLNSYFRINSMNANEIELKIGKILTNIININNQNTNLDKLINYKSERSLNEILKDVKVKNLDANTFNQYVEQKLKEEYSKIVSEITKDTNRDYEILKMNLDLGRINVLGFSIGDITLKDVSITLDINEISKDMEKIFLYLRVILGYFSTWRDSKYEFQYLQVRDKKYNIWNPDDYPDIPRIHTYKPDSISQEEYDKKRKLNEDAVTEILTIKLVALFKKVLNESLNNDGEDQDINSLEIKNEINIFYFAESTDYKSKVNARSDMTFKLKWLTFKIKTGDVTWFNSKENNEED